MDNRKDGNCHGLKCNTNAKCNNNRRNVINPWQFPSFRLSICKFSCKNEFYCNLLFSFSWVQVVFYVYLLSFVANLHFLVLYIKRISIFVFLPFFVFCFSFCVFLYFLSLFLYSFFLFRFFIPFSFISFLYFNCFLFSFSVNFIFLFSLFVILFSVLVILFCCFPFYFLVILSVPDQLLKSGFVVCFGHGNICEHSFR